MNSIFRPNSPGPLTDVSSVNFHDVYFFIFCYNLAKMKKFMDESSVTFQSSVSGAGEFDLKNIFCVQNRMVLKYSFE